MVGKILKNLRRQGKLTTVLFSIIFGASCFAQEAPLKIAIFDTGFCPSKIKTNHILNSDFLAKENCKILDRKRFHGHYVLKEFLAALKTKRKLEIFLFKIFDQNGVQQEALWQRALAVAKNKKVVLSLMAVGYPYKVMPKWQLPSVSIVASGQKGKGITKQTKLWPQELKSKDRFLVAGLIKGNLPEVSLKKYLKYYIELPAQNPKRKV